MTSPTKFCHMTQIILWMCEFYTSLLKGLKLKVRKFWGLIATFVELTGEKLVGGAFLPLPPQS